MLLLTGVTLLMSSAVLRFWQLVSKYRNKDKHNRFAFGVIRKLVVVGTVAAAVAAAAAQLWALLKVNSKAATNYSNNKTLQLCAIGHSCLS